MIDFISLHQSTKWRKPLAPIVSWMLAWWMIEINGINLNQFIHLSHSFTIHVIIFRNSSMHDKQMNQIHLWIYSLRQCIDWLLSIWVYWLKQLIQSVNENGLWAAAHSHQLLQLLFDLFHLSELKKTWHSHNHHWFHWDEFNSLNFNQFTCSKPMKLTRWIKTINCFWFIRCSLHGSCFIITVN